LIGWYAFADQLHSEHLRIQKKYISLFSENPVFLLFDKNISSEGDKLPLTAFVDEQVEGLSHIFVELPFHVQSSQIEKITMDTVMRSIPADGLSELEVENKSSLSSLRQLDKRLTMLVKTIQWMHENKIPKNHQLIRKASKICKLLGDNSSTSTTINSDLSQQFDEQLNADLITTFLSTVTKTNLSLAEVADVYSLIYGDMQANNAMMGF